MEEFLSKRERQELLCELRLERNAKFSDRIKCILLLDSDKSYEEISEFLFLSSEEFRKTVIPFFKSIKRYRVELRTLMTLKFHIAA